MKAKITLLLLIPLLSSLCLAEDFSAYYPGAKGKTWNYKVSKQSIVTIGKESSKQDKSGTMREEVIDVIDNSIAVIQRTVTEGSVTVQSTLHVRIEPAVISIVAIGVGSAQPIKLPVAQPLLLDQLPGASIDGSQGPMRMASQLVSQMAANVDVRAGSFADCLLTESKGVVTGRLNNMSIKEGSIVVKSWYARDVGMVREDRVLKLNVTTAEGADLVLEDAASKTLDQYTK